MHFRSSVENPTRFQTKMGEMYTRFQTKTAQKNISFGAAHTTGLYKGVTPTLPSVCATKCTHCFSPDRKSDMSGCHLLFFPIPVYIFMFRGKIQLLKHREFTLGDSDMILIIMTSLLDIEIRKGNAILIAHEQGKASYNENETTFVSLISAFYYNY